MPFLHLDGQAILTDMFLKCDAIINSRKPIALIIVLRPDEHGLLAALSKKNCQMEQFNSQQFNSQQKKTITSAFCPRNFHDDIKHFVHKEKCAS